MQRDKTAAELTSSYNDHNTTRDRKAAQTEMFPWEVKREIIQTSQLKTSWGINQPYNMYSQTLYW